MPYDALVSVLLWKWLASRTVSFYFSGSTCSASSSLCLLPSSPEARSITAISNSAYLFMAYIIMYSYQ